jgi:hypothetical protein
MEEEGRGGTYLCRGLELVSSALTNLEGSRRRSRDRQQQHHFKDRRIVDPARENSLHSSVHTVGNSLSDCDSSWRVSRITPRMSPRSAHTSLSVFDISSLGI